MRTLESALEASSYPSDTTFKEALDAVDTAIEKIMDRGKVIAFPKKKVPPPLPITITSLGIRPTAVPEDDIEEEIYIVAPEGAGGDPPRESGNFYAEHVFRPKFMYAAHCKQCGWPGEGSGVDIVEETCLEEARKTAQKRHNNSWMAYAPQFRCQASVKISHISSEDTEE
jgi:hypothetical protein